MIYTLMILSWLMIQQPLDNYEWIDLPESGQMSLRKNGVQVGIWVPDKGYFARLSSGKFAEQSSELPIPLPLRKPNFGVVENKINPRPTYRINGRNADRAEVHAALTGGLPDDSGLSRLTLIGAKADCDRVAGDLANHPALAPCRGKLIVRSFAPDHWAVKDLGFKTDGKPTLYCQTPNGLVLHRQDDYEGGPEALAEALRKADPAYDPNKDPDKRKNDPSSPFPPCAGLPGLLLGSAAIVLVLTTIFRKK